MVLTEGGDSDCWTLPVPDDPADTPDGPGLGSSDATGGGDAEAGLKNLVMSA